MEIHLSGKVYFYARDLARRIGRRHGWEADQVGKVKHLLLNLAPIMGKKTSIFAVLPDENLILAKTINCYLDYEKDS